MTETLRIPFPASRSRENTGSWKSYLALGLGINVALWSSALMYLNVKQPTYLSILTVNLPEANSKTAVNVPNIGQASTTEGSPYGNHYDTRATYSVIAQSETVLSAAAKQLNLSEQEFDKPRIRMIDNTTLMEFELSGKSPEEAQAKASALYNVLESRLRELRVEEAAIQKADFEEVVGASRTKLLQAQQRLSDFKVRSGFISNDQISALTSGVEELRKEQAQILAQQKLTETRFLELSNSLGLSAQQATEALSLQTDPSWQEILSAHSQSNAALVDLNSRYTSNNPSVLREKARQEATQTALMARSQSLLKKPISLEYIEQLSLHNSEARQELLQQFITIQADREALQSQAQEIERQLAQLENKLKSLAGQQLIVDSLQRDILIAEAIFSSKLTQLDLSNSNLIGSYPQLQPIDAPSLSTEPSSPNAKFILLGTTLGSILLTTAVVMLWLSSRKASSLNWNRLASLEATA